MEFKPFRKVIAVDFDGTLCCSWFPDANHQNWLNKLILAYVKYRQKKGDLIILWTCRTDSEESYSSTKSWVYDNCLTLALRLLKYRGNFVPDLVNENAQERTDAFDHNSRKISADVYIDNFNIGLLGWLMNYVDKRSKKKIYKGSRNRCLKKQ